MAETNHDVTPETTADESVAPTETTNADTGVALADGPPTEGKPPAAEGDGDEETADEEGESDPDNAADVIARIESGEISVNAMDAIVAAINARNAATANPNQTPGAQQPPQQQQQAPAMAPGGQSMSGADTKKFAALQGEVTALRAQANLRDAADTRRTDVAEALTRLHNRALPSDAEAQFSAFHEKHGADAFKDYVEGYEKSVGVVPDDSAAAARFAGQGGSVNTAAPEEVLAFQDQGPDAVEAASRAHDEWKMHSGRGMRTSAKAYLDQRMTRAGFSAAAST